MSCPKILAMFHKQVNIWKHSQCKYDILIINKTQQIYFKNPLREFLLS